jgi:RHS repeat-associated protein
MYQYDANGNLTRKTLLATGNYTQYSYDAENRLVKVEDFIAGNPTPAFTSTYRYDGLGRRIEKVANGQTKRYVYDGEDILLEFDGSNVLQARYTHGPGIDEPIAVTRGGATHFYHQDGLGTVTELTDSAGVTAKSYAYDAWGNILQQTGTVENAYTFTGREFDAESGLYHYRARTYDATIGRFFQKDPIGIAGGNNTYPYVGGHPLGFIDPSGEIAVPLVAAGALVGGIVNTSIYAATTQQFTWQGAAGSFVGGAIGGAISTVATPIAAGAGLGTGFGGTALVNAAAGVIGNVISAAFDPCQDITPSYLASSALYSAVGGAAAQKYFPTVGMQVFGQVGFPRTWSAFIPQWLGGNAGRNANALTQGGIVSGAFGAVGPNYVQSQAGTACPCP